MGSYVMWWCLT